MMHIYRINLAGPKNNYTGPEERAIPYLPWTSRFSFWASNFSFSLARGARDQASHLPTKSFKEQTRHTQGKQNLRAICPKLKLEFKFF